jgi:exodeoxyribonuclease V beta subunit
MEPFDIARNPLLEGSCLIEAGAGTGKTYALTAIFLRLLVEKQIAPDRILVVTFTTAATAELRDRLRRQLVGVRRYADGEGPLEDVLREIVDRADAMSKVREAVVGALREFDRIAIFTIHGFCQRLLGELAFETGSPFEVELLADSSTWIQGAAEDYWRETFFEAEPELADYALARLKGPESLATLYLRYGMPDLHVVPAMPELPAIDFEAYRRDFESLQQQWPTAKNAVAALLESPALNGTIYGALKPLPGGPPGRTKRRQKVAAWCRALAHFLQQETAPFPICPSMIYFTSAKISAATRKGQTPPRHPFFDDGQCFFKTADRLQRALDQWLTALRYRFFAYADRKLERQKQERQSQFFDDLLVRLARTLEGQRGDRLVAAVRRQYQAALVDEFQDTDPTQYQIFKRLFATADHRLLMIGDPKQAIYGFRGADIFAYLRAARQADRKFTLLRNWRSSPELIQAVNRLFQNRPQPFLIPEITYHPAVAACPAAMDDNRRSLGAALTFWMMTADKADGPGAVRPLTKKKATERILIALAAEVGRLVGRQQGTSHTNAGRWAARDIAILVRTNRQARLVKACLQDAQIPAVIHNAGNVFGTPEADGLEHVLRAVAQPNDTSRLKTALVTPFFGVEGDRLVLETQDPDWWEAMRLMFLRHQATWQAAGFFPFFREMLAAHRIAERLLALSDGERRLTNLLHLGELLHQASMRQRTGLRGTLKWLQEQKILLSGDLDEQQLRMESDAEALTILTIHKSKGLEFPVVFHPFGWEADPHREAWALFHDPAAGMRRTLDIGGDISTAHQDLARQERMAESLRLLYVAVTRAKRKCYLIWGDLPSATDSALGYLLTADASEPDAGGPGLTPVASDTVHDAGTPVQRLVQKAGDTIEARPLPASPGGPLPPGAPGPRLGNARALPRRLDAHWKIASFSSLIRAPHMGGEEAVDRDRDATLLPTGDDGLNGMGDGLKLMDNMHLFPRGAHAGNLFHSLFENLDFSRPEPQAWMATVESELVQRGFEGRWALPVARLIARVLATPLPPDRLAFCLNRLAPRDGVKEMPFAFPLGRLDAEGLRAVFIRHALPLPRSGLERQLRKLNFIISGGFLRGFIDLVFRVEGRYYLLDWKSNYLGQDYADYQPARLKTVMAEDYYFLQYHLYTLALDQFLRLRLPAYDYERDFGGVYYLFIRGMRSAAGADGGVFYDRPQASLIEDLRSLLLPQQT